ncbi:hypothetical protein [uncultured Faecalicoccus sp.]|uniref:hypothetical protein n=1 Tax=uncultured Faecalicoccus sp. TaxID=1971760 RepID=UPI002636D9C4|nr:hypothetical protein [uncultured Faecalicoccus sp.]
MADRFLGALKGLERRSKDNVLIFSDVLTERLDALIETMIGAKLTDNDYLKTLELYYKKYQRFENHEGMYFCILRMQQILKYKNEKRFQNQFGRLEFTKDPLNDALVFVEQHKDYYQKVQEEYLRVYLLIILLVAIGILVFGVLVLDVPFFACWIFTMLIYAVLWGLGKKVGIERLMEKQIVKLYPKLDELCVKLDQSAMKRKSKKSY